MSATTNSDNGLLTLRIPPEIKARLHEIAVAEDRTISSFVRRLIDRRLEQEAKRHAGTSERTGKSRPYARTA
jgi:predicted transcriptional regulator